MKVLVIPDVHLKPWMFDQAEELLNKYNLDTVVFIGDLVDDWNQGCNIQLYKDTINRAMQFKKDYPNSKFCYGNHEVGYMLGGICAGNSEVYHNEILEMLNKYERLVEPQLAFKIDNVVFSHGGIALSKFGDYSIENIENVKIKNAYDDDDSPLWARPNPWVKYDKKYTQVAGHSPMEHITKIDNVWFVDSFGFDPNGMQYGDQTYLSIDTITLETHMYKDGERIA